MQTKSRLTIDMTPEDHMHLKTSCAKMGVSMKDFLMQLAFNKIEELEDEFLSAKAEETLQNISSGKEKLILWEDAKKQLNA